MKMCYDCPDFKIQYEPLKSGRDVWDYGRAKCLKHDLIIDFASYRKLKKLECIEEVQQVVYCEDEECIYNKRGCCEHILPTGCKSPPASDVSCCRKCNN